MSVGNILTIVGLGITLLTFAVAYGVLKGRVEQNSKDIEFLKTSYTNIYNLLSDIRVQIASLSTKVDERNKMNNNE